MAELQGRKNNVNTSSTGRRRETVGHGKVISYQYCVVSSLYRSAHTELWRVTVKSQLDVTLCKENQEIAVPACILKILKQSRK